MKNWWLAIASVLLISAATLVFIGFQKPSGGTACGPYRTDKELSVGPHKLNTEVVDTPASLAKGLGGRPCIPRDDAMLFVFNKPGYYSFWMKDMEFPIDIVWLNAQHKVVTVKQNVSPATYPQKFANGQSAQYVLELQANSTKSLDIRVGTPINF